LATTAEAVRNPDTPFYRLGGHETMQAICNRFYDLMDSDPAYAELRAMHAPDLTHMRKSLAGFLAAWSGGPRDWFAENPGKCMMSAHKPYAISPEVAAQWADAMKRAIADVAPEDAALAKAMGGVLEEMALGMVRQELANP
jgi:hemoglobin